MNNLDDKLRAQYEKLAKPARYGTAGFRDLAINMPYISFRVGIFVTILNKTQPSKSLGVIISASHNKIEDNGVKITNFKGNMLEKFYEPILEQFVNEKDLSKALNQFKTYLTQQKGKSICQSLVNVFIGGDTRPSTPELLNLVARGIEYAEGKAVNFKLVTTPQLQYYVYLSNILGKEQNKSQQEVDPQLIRPLYWRNFSSYYKNCIKYLKSNQIKHRCLDCANGVGGIIILQFLRELKDLIDLRLINNKNPELLNKKSGADFIKITQAFPSEYEPTEHNCFISFDGDADRIVLFVQIQKKLALIDGDRQGTIFTTFFKRINEELKQRTNDLNKTFDLKIKLPCDPTIGFVQTFYANFSSSQYLRQHFLMEPIYTPTGVKFLHEKAENFDIGIYFQANGHGTVIFNQDFIAKIQAFLSSKNELLQSELLKKNHELLLKIQDYFDFAEFYLNACKLANPSVGDAICNFLIFEIALDYLKLSYQDTLTLYTNLNSKTSKVAVKRKQKIKTTEIEDKIISPQGLQQKIDEIIKKYHGRKAFLRPSGTQNCLRLHVEAESIEQVEIITKQIQIIVSTHPQLN